MPLIFDTKEFTVMGHDHPHHDRNNGGHAVITPKHAYADRTQMPLSQYTTMMQLVRITGVAIASVMRSKGIDVVRINYQDNGNWAYFPQMKRTPQLHVHLYVRSTHEKHPTGDERFLAFPNALFFPFIGDHPEYYESFYPYSEQDCADFKSEIERLLQTKEYWELKNTLFENR